MKTKYTNINPNGLIVMILISTLPLLSFAQSVTGFTLINAATNQAIQSLENGDVLNLANLPQGLNVRANTNPAVVGSVRFAFQANSNYRTENVAPYALEGDQNGNYYSWTPSTGLKNLSATAFASSNAGGVAGTTLSIQFTVINEAPSQSFPPTGLSLSPVSSTELLLAWSPPENGNDYEIQWDTDPAFSNPASDGLYYGYNELTYGGLLPNTTYYFRIRTNYNNVTSAWSETATGTTLSESFPPIGLSLTPVSTTQLLLAWSPPENGNDYEIQWDTDPAFSNPASDGLYYGYDELTYGGLLPNTTYYFRIRTNYNNVTSAWSETATGTTLSESFPPIGLSLTPVSTTQLLLAWSPPENGNDYEIQWDTDPAFSNPASDGLYYGYDELTYGGLLPNTTYYFRIRTNYNNVTSAWSETATGTTLSNAPNGPQVISLTLVNASNDQDIRNLQLTDTLILSQLPASLSIRANPGASGVGSVRFGLNGNTNIQTESVAPYAISGDSNGDYNAWSAPLGSNVLTATPYSNGGGNGTAGAAYSIQLFVTNQGSAAPPTAPSGLTAEGVNPNQIDLTWSDNSNNETGFVVEKASSFANIYAPIASLPANTVSYSDNTLTFGELAYYRVKAINAAGESAYAGPVGASTPFGDALPPTNVMASTMSSTEILLTWDPPFFGNDYEIQWSTSPSFANPVTDAIYFGFEELLVFQLNPATTYYFRIRTFLEGEASAWSQTAQATTLSNGGQQAASITGELKKWHAVTISYQGPQHAETDNNPNPFLDYRLNVTFAHPASGKTYVVPGYFAADGNAAESSANSGNVWRVHFTPDETGTWNYSWDCRTGANLAVSTSASAGSPVVSLNGLSGQLSISASDKSGIDFRSKGRLSYVGKHHLQFEETGEYFIKGGADAPENFLAYDDFDNTPNNGNRRKSWAPHAGDYNAGDPTWQSNKGTEMMGALNYLAEEGMNVFSFLTMNINGDDKNVFPYVADNNLTHFDISKLDQWDIVFSHAQRKGLYLHFKTQETENDQLLDGGQLGNQRKLYYRMLIAHFGHHLALNWNLGEENDIWQELNDPNNNIVKSYAQFFYDNDPYRHNVVIHTYPGQQDEVYDPLLGATSKLTGVSIQTNWNNVYNDTKRWVEDSEAAGVPWVVANDEQGSANIGVPPFVGYIDPSGNTFNGTSVDHDDIRKETLWGNFMAGGAGVEYYFGYQVPQSDLSCQDYRSRDGMWDYTRHALEFFRENLPFQEMAVSNGLASTGRVLALVDSVYAIQLKNGGTANLTITGGTYAVKWFNPRSGNFEGATATVTGPGSVSLGNPPSAPGQDWVVLVTKQAGGTVEPEPQEGIAINAGGGAYTAVDGTAYQADVYFGGGSTYTAGAQISNTSDDELYRSERYASNLNYSIPLENGVYSVILQFAEVYFSDVNKRVFDVMIEGEMSIDGLDIYAEAGKNAAFDYSREVTISDGVLDIKLTASINNAKIAGIKVSPAAQAISNPTSAGLIYQANSSAGIAVTIYPNPASDVLFVNGAKAGAAIIYNTAGVPILNMELVNGQLDISSLTAGMYIIALQGMNGTEHTRFVKQ